MSVKVQIGIKGRSLPAGGTAGQILQKSTGEDFDCVWTTPAGGSSANIPQPGVTTPVADTGSGSAGSSVAFAPIDHYHPFNVPTSGAPKMDYSTGTNGTATTYARSDHQHPVDTSRAADSALTALSGTVTSYKAEFIAFTVTLPAEV